MNVDRLDNLCGLGLKGNNTSIVMFDVMLLPWQVVFKLVKIFRVTRAFVDADE